MKIVCISDTHLQHGFAVPSGDVLIHAGDLTIYGDTPEIAQVGHWLRGLPHPLKLVIAGNHDRLFQEQPDFARVVLGPGIIHIQDELVLLPNRLKVFGSPWSIRFMDWWFQLDHTDWRPKRPDSERPFLLNRNNTGPRTAAEHWKQIPEGLDILITHGPPFGVLDTNHRGDHLGDQELTLALERLREPPRLVVFGHIHDGHGIFTTEEVSGHRITFVNAAICDDTYDPVHEPIVVDLEPRERRQ